MPLENCRNTFLALINQQNEGTTDYCTFQFSVIAQQVYTLMEKTGYLVRDFGPEMCFQPTSFRTGGLILSWDTSPGTAQSTRGVDWVFEESMIEAWDNKEEGKRMFVLVQFCLKLFLFFCDQTKLELSDALFFTLSARWDGVRAKH